MTDAGAHPPGFTVEGGYVGLWALYGAFAGLYGGYLDYKELIAVMG